MGSSVSKSELPENANLRPQAYRHVDLVTFLDSQAPAKFAREWQKNPKTQRAAFLIGEYSKVKNPFKTGKRAKDPKWPDELLYAKVHTLYESNQIHQPKGVVFQKDG